MPLSLLLELDESSADEEEDEESDDEESDDLDPDDEDDDDEPGGPLTSAPEGFAPGAQVICLGRSVTPTPPHSFSENLAATDRLASFFGAWFI